MSRYLPCVEGCPHVGYCDKRMLPICRIAFDNIRSKLGEQGK